MSHRRGRYAAVRSSWRQRWRPGPVVRACADPQPAAAVSTFGEELLGADSAWRPTSLGVLGNDFMAQRPRVDVLPARQAVDVGSARVTSYRPSHDCPALTVDGGVRVKDGVPRYGGRCGTIVHFDCAAEWSVGVVLAGGEIVYFAPAELDPAPVADTLVMSRIDFADDTLLMGGAR